MSVTLDRNRRAIETRLAATRCSAGQPVTLGIRPEHLEPAFTAGTDAQQITRTVSLVEQLGEHSYLHLDQPGGAVLIAKAPGDKTPRQGERVAFNVPAASCHLFTEDGFAVPSAVRCTTCVGAHRMRLGVCYYPEHWPESMWKDDAARMKALGIDRVRIAEFAWSRIEPSPGEYHWDWLDRAIDVLADAGLKVVMCTPTATPPKWLIDRHPDILPVGADGRPRAFGSRRHYDFSSPSYFEASQKICTAVAERYGKHPAVAFWQTDNEFGCHHTVVSYSPAALQRVFASGSRQRYGTIDALNTAWGTVFWSMEYRSFDEIDLPVAHRDRSASVASAGLPPFRLR